MMLVGEGISKSFAGLQALSNVSFQIEQGEIVGLMGPNGAGKTTLFEIISGFQRPTRGSIRLNGRNIVGLPPHRLTRLGLARTFQHPRPYYSMTVADHVRTGFAFGRTGSDGSGSAAGQAAPGAIEDLLALCELADKVDVPAAQLTAVDRKRLEIARVLACRPQLALIDEPVQGLNPTEAVEAIGLIRRIRDELGVTVFLVEHNLRVLMGVCDRIIVLNHGQKIAEGDPQEVARNPQVIEAYLGTGAVPGAR